MFAWDENAALLVVDVQNDFADTRGSLAVPEGCEILSVLNEAMRRAGVRPALAAP